MIFQQRVSRRFFLGGLGGAVVALPFLESLAPKRAGASDGAHPFLINFVQIFGVQQRYRFGGPHGGETERFWPDLDASAGRVNLSDGALPDIATNDRAVHELRGLEQHLAILRGVRFHELNEQHHETRRTQLLTGSAHNFERPISDRSSEHHQNAWGRHESLDFKVARELDASRPILCGKNTEFAQMSFDQTVSRVSTETNPMTVYDLLFRSVSLSANEQRRRQLATDTVAAELNSIRMDTRLSSEDRQRLDRHFDALRDVERSLTCMVPEMGSPSLSSLRASLAVVPTLQDDGMFHGESPIYQDRNYNQETTQAFMEVLALGASCNAFRSAGITTSGHYFAHTDIFSDEGERGQGFVTAYHPISHRTLSRDGSGEWAGAGDMEHHRIDRWHLRRFRFLVERLRDLGALNEGVCVYANEIATGAHEAADVPFILAGNCKGRLQNGFYADLHGPGAPDQSRCIPNNRLLNTIGAAMGLRSADGAVLHDFGGIRPDGGVDEGGHIADLVNFS
jgi:hypothetical protein